MKRLIRINGVIVAAGLLVDFYGIYDLSIGSAALGLVMGVVDFRETLRDDVFFLVMILLLTALAIGFLFVVAVFTRIRRARHPHPRPRDGSLHHCNPKLDIYFHKERKA